MNNQSIFIMYSTPNEKFVESFVREFENINRDLKFKLLLRDNIQLEKELKKQCEESVRDSSICVCFIGEKFEEGSTQSHELSFAKKNDVPIILCSCPNATDVNRYNALSEFKDKHIFKLQTESIEDANFYKDVNRIYSNISKVLNENIEKSNKEQLLNQKNSIEKEWKDKYDKLENDIEKEREEKYTRLENNLNEHNALLKKFLKNNRNSWYCYIIVIVIVILAVILAIMNQNSTINDLIQKMSYREKQSKQIVENNNHLLQLNDNLKITNKDLKKKNESILCAYQALSTRNKSDFISLLKKTILSAKKSPTWSAKHILFNTLARQEEIVFNIEKHKNAVLTVAVDSAQKRKLIITGGSDGYIYFLQIYHSKLPYKDYELYLDSHPITGLAILEYRHNKCTIVCGNNKGDVYACHIPLNNFIFPKTPLKHFENVSDLQCQHGIFGIAKKQGDKILAIGCFDQISLFTYQKQDKISYQPMGKATIDGDEYFTAMSFGPENSPYFACGTQNGHVQLWNINDFPDNPIEMKNNHATEIKTIAFHPEKEQICVGGLDNAISILQLESSSLTQICQIPMKHGALALSYAQEAPRLYIASSQPIINILNTNSNLLNKDDLNPGHTNHISFIYPVEKNAILTGDYDGNIKYTHIFRPTPLSSTTELSMDIQYIDFISTPDSQNARIVAAGIEITPDFQKENNIYLFEMTNNLKIFPGETIIQKNGTITDIDINSKNEILYSTDYGIIGVSHLYTETGFDDLKFIRSYHDNQFVTGNEKEIHQYTVENNQISRIKTIRSFNKDDKDTIITCLDVHSKSQMIVFATNKNKLYINEDNPIDIHTTLYSICFSKDGKQISAGDQNGQIYLTETGNLKALIDNPIGDNSNTGRVIGIAFSPSDSDLFVSSAINRSLTVWSISRKEILGRITNAHKSTITDIVFHPHGDLLVSCGSDKTIRVWAMSLKQWIDKADSLINNYTNNKK